MTNSRNTTSSKAWKKRTGGVDLTLPSGNVCLVKRPGMDKLLSAGILPDSLTPIAMEHIRKAEAGGKPPAKDEDAEIEKEIMEKVLEDPSKINEIFQSFDKVVAMCVVEPKVELHFREIFVGEESRGFEDIPDDERISDENDEFLEGGEPNPLYSADPPLYTDEVDQEDKQFIFQFVVGGSSDLEPFRSESGADVAPAQSGEDV